MGGTHSRVGCEEMGADLAWEGAWGGGELQVVRVGGIWHRWWIWWGGLGCCQDLTPSENSPCVRGGALCLAQAAWRGASKPWAPLRGDF